MALIAGYIRQMGIMRIGLQVARLHGQFFRISMTLQTDRSGDGNLRGTFLMAGRTSHPLRLVPVREKRTLLLSPGTVQSRSQDAGGHHKGNGDEKISSGPSISILHGIILLLQTMFPVPVLFAGQQDPAFQEA
jgi:hypothetical protein